MISFNVCFKIFNFPVISGDFSFVFFEANKVPSDFDRFFIREFICLIYLCLRVFTRPYSTNTQNRSTLVIWIAAEGAAMSLLERFPDAHDGYDRLGMVYAAQADRNDRLAEVDKAQKNKREAAECYRKAIEVIRRHPDDFGSSLKKTFEELVKQLDPPAKRARSGSARKGQSKPPAA
jgi:hypothetical protein